MNLNYLFHLEYYKEFSYAHFKKCNNKLISAKFFDSKRHQIHQNEYSFLLKTVYPGLLVGIGNLHGAGGDFIHGKPEDGAEIKLGFTLDYVTGMPIIPGSTVKGVLRSAFTYHPEYIAQEMDLTEVQLKKLEEEIFGENSSGTVVFFDAIPEKSSEKGLLGLENITPHTTNEPGYEGLTSPNPLTLLKIIPDVHFRFYFGFDAWHNESVPCAQLVDIFKTILLDLGIGAKTNVGFGIFEMVGKCKTCGAPTGINSQTDEYYEFCALHNKKLTTKQKGV